MKRFSKSIISLILAAAVILTSALVPAAASTKCTCGQEPVVYVAALGSAKLYKDAGTENERIIFRPETSAYIKLVAKLIVPIFSLIASKDYDAFADSLIPAVEGVFGDLANGENGLSTPDVTIKRELPTDPAHGIDKSYYFGYDLRQDPCKTAEELDEFIDYILKLTGHDKVRFRASSMGGVITMAYLEKFGSEKIKSIIFQCCPIKGTAVAGDLFCGNLNINATSLYRYGELALPLLMDNGTASVLLGLIKILKVSGILSSAVDMVNRVVDGCAERVYDELLIPVFKANCGVWSFVSDEYYEQAKQFMLGSLRNEELENRIDYYHYNVQCKAEEILNETKQNGVPIMIVAAWGLQRTPLVDSWENDSDGTVDTKYASVGARVALLGKTLEDKSQAVEDSHSHISPDGNIDASTCALPENTWFIKDMLHCKTHAGHHALYSWFFSNDNNPDALNVNSNPNYPQFLQNDVNAKALTEQK